MAIDRALNVCLQPSQHGKSKNPPKVILISNQASVVICESVANRPVAIYLNTLVRITSERTIKLTGEQQQQTRYYISSKGAGAQIFNHMVRSHWSIENKLQGVMDVTFKDDHSRKRTGNSAFNFNIITKVALKILEKNKGTSSKPLTRLRATADDGFRHSLINNF